RRRWQLRWLVGGIELDAFPRQFVEQSVFRSICRGGGLREQNKHQCWPDDSRHPRIVARSRKGAVSRTRGPAPEVTKPAPRGRVTMDLRNASSFQDYAH